MTPSSLSRDELEQALAVAVVAADRARAETLPRFRAVAVEIKSDGSPVTEADRAAERELLADPKEIAEHLMLIDLGRNDVGRVAKPGKVTLTDKMVVERYSHVMHIVSNVEGELRDGLGPLDVLRATFPAGTLSGAPKIRAMEIIDELELTRRGCYGGAVGYFSFDGNSDTAITIRTIIVKDGIAYVQAGGGIVADSVKETEFQETINKARTVIRAVELAELGLE